MLAAGLLCSSEARACQIYSVSEVLQSQRRRKGEEGRGLGVTMVTGFIKDGVCAAVGATVSLCACLKYGCLICRLFSLSILYNYFFNQSFGF